jgi:glycosyltransferase involved in cell wall biosynthesis
MTARKVIVQVPCYNEEATLAVTLADLPRQLEGVNTVEWLVIDDGSTDNTLEVARRHGADHIVRLERHGGLAAAFRAGLAAAVQAGADIIVNTDADNQYCAADIPRLIEPILLGAADIVVGCRPISQITHFSRVKIVCERLGSAIVRILSSTCVADTASGFRALSRRAALRLRLVSHYSYTQEMLIEAGAKGIVVGSVPIRVNPPLRPSRLMKGIGGYIWRQAITIVAAYIRYRVLPVAVWRSASTESTVAVPRSSSLPRVWQARVAPNLPDSAAEAQGPDERGTGLCSCLTKPSDAHR